MHYPFINLGVIRSTRYYHEHGRCYTFRPPRDVEKPVPGEKHGYRLYFYLIPSTQATTLMFPGGFDIFVHDSDIWWSGNE